MAVFLDLKKAFDTVGHDILLSKLSKFNFSQKAFSWFASYLDSREQCVKIDCKKSATRMSKTGIPQRSILGPLLFTLYINDLPETCPGAGCQLYADDTAIYASAKTSNEACTLLSVHMSKIAQWIHQKRLTPNMKKTVSMCFSIKNGIQTGNPCATIQGEAIEMVNEFKYLGIILDSNLRFDKHEKKVAKTVKSNINCFKLIRPFIPTKAALLFMHAMILSHVLLCYSVESSVPVYN